MKINANKYANKPRTEVRRPEYAVEDDAWIKSLLTRGAFGTLGSLHEDQPFLTPLLFIYIEEDHAIYFHGAQVGRTRANIDLHPVVCFNITEYGRLLAADKAVDFNIEYNSATVFGKAAVIGEEEEAKRALQLLMDKYAPHLKPGIDYIPTRTEDFKRTSVYKLAIEEWSGKKQEKTDEYLEAYNYPHPPQLKK